MTFEEGMELMNRSRSERDAISLDDGAGLAGTAPSMSMCNRGLALGVGGHRGEANVLDISANTTRQAWLAQQAQPAARNCLGSRACRLRIVRGEE